MRIAVIIPTRKDRPGFLDNCLRMIWKQTLQPEIVRVVDYEPTSDKIDITQRYRIGYDSLRGLGLDVIFLWEDDDAYLPTYIEYMVSMWEKYGKPDLFGTGFTIYYHIGIRAWYKMQHDQRASAMNTMIKPDLQIEWCVDEEPFTDLFLWGFPPHIHARIKNKIVFLPDKILSIGIKHGVGKTVPASNHVIDDRVRRRYCNLDPDFAWLRSNMDEESFKFYSTYFDDKPVG